jgi:hypothetical protein
MAETSENVNASHLYLEGKPTGSLADWAVASKVVDLAAASARLRPHACVIAIRIAILAIALVAGMSSAIAQTASPRYYPVYGISSPLSSVALFANPCCSPSDSPNVGIYGVPFLGVPRGGHRDSEPAGKLASRWPGP